MRNILMTYGLLISIFPLFGQKLNSSVSKKEFLIGEKIELKYSVKVKKNDSVFFEPVKGDLQARSKDKNSTLSGNSTNFEQLEEFWETLITGKNEKEWQGTYTVTAWDSGIFILPAPIIVINDSTLYFEELTISCGLVKAEKDKDIYDIRENYAEIPEKEFSFKEFLTKKVLRKQNWWILVLLMLFVGFYIYWRKKRKAELPEMEPIVSLKQRTLIAIEALENEKRWEKGKLKEHFVELSYILRSYLTARYSISLLERTTHESKLLLREKGLNDDTIDIIIRILTSSDLVKFAKSAPEVIEILKISTLAKQVVAETSPLEFDNVE